MLRRAMMEAASTSETSVNFYQTTRLNNPEDSHLHYLSQSCRLSFLSDGFLRKWELLAGPGVRLLSNAVCWRPDSASGNRTLNVRPSTSADKINKVKTFKSLSSYN
jgi:hypothetical protein